MNEIQLHTGGAEHNAFEHLTGGVTSLERAMPSLAAHMQDFQLVLESQLPHEFVNIVLVLTN